MNEYLTFKCCWISDYEFKHGNKPCKAMRDSLDRMFSTNPPVETWWLSFCDNDKPIGFKFLGVIIIDGCDFTDALCRANYLRINPGGEVEGANITNIHINIKQKDKNRLLTKKEASAYDE